MGFLVIRIEGGIEVSGLGLGLGRPVYRKQIVSGSIVHRGLSKTKNKKKRCLRCVTQVYRCDSTLQQIYPRT